MTTATTTQKVVISERFGGFGLSRAAALRIAELRGVEPPAHAPWAYDRDIPRDDPALIRVVEEMGDAAGSEHARLRVIEIPAGTKWHVHEYDGYETLHEEHRSWDSNGPTDCP